MFGKSLSASCPSNSWGRSKHEKACKVAFAELCRCEDTSGLLCMKSCKASERQTSSVSRRKRPMRVTQDRWRRVSGEWSPNGSAGSCKRWSSQSYDVISTPRIRKHTKIGYSFTGKGFGLGSSPPHYKAWKKRRSSASRRRK